MLKYIASRSGSFIPKMHMMLLLLFTSVTTAEVNAQQLPDSLTKKIDALFKKWDNPGSPGCVIGIVRNDSLIYARGYGQANLEYGIPNTPETIFHMASVSKQFTGYAMVMLAREGKLNLDDDIRKYLNWFSDLKEKITIRHLLNHTSGIRDQWQLLAISGTRIDDVITQEHIVKLLQKQRALNFKPGDQYSYSNSGYTLLAEIVKSVTGQTLRQFADSAIFKPLSMNQTHFHDNYQEIVKNRSYSYYSKSDGGFSNSILSYSNVGATSLFTNVNDMAKWVMNFYNPKLGTLQDIEELARKGRLNNGKESPYGLGIITNTFKGWTHYSHNGADAGYRTSVNIIPEKKTGFILFSNLGNFEMGKIYELAGMFIPEKGINTADQPVAVIDSNRAVLKNPASIMRNLGDYLSDDGAKYQFKLSNQKLYGIRQGRTELLVRVSKDTFEVASDPKLRFLFKTNKIGDTLVQELWPGGQLFKKYDLNERQTVKQLQAYAGVYYCPELDCKYGIVVKGQDLVLTNNKYEDVNLKFLGRDHLKSDFWWMAHLRILRGKQDKIQGFEVNDGRVMHLRFNKIQ